MKSHKPVIINLKGEKKQDKSNTGKEMAENIFKQKKDIKPEIQEALIYPKQNKCKTNKHQQGRWQ